jgi:hypothetical protein
LASAAIVVTGNPFTDGWDYSGRSNELGTYTRGLGLNNTAIFDYNVYSKVYTIDAGSNLLFSSNWQIGDTIVALGGVMNSVVDVTFRSVTKFGSPDSIYSAASDVALCHSQGVSGAACGKSGNEAGHGGPGSVLFGYNFVRNGSGNVTALNPGESFTIKKPETIRYYDETVVNPANRDVSYSADAAFQDYGRIYAVFDTSGNDKVLSWETFLNLSALGRDARFSADDLPGIGEPSIVTFQRSTNSTEFTDAVVFANVAAAVPEPGTVALLGLGLIGLAVSRKRRA